MLLAAVTGATAAVLSAAPSEAAPTCGGLPATIVGTAVARIVESIATRLVVIMIAMRIGPRSERKPTPSDVVVVSAVLRGLPLA